MLDVLTDREVATIRCAVEDAPAGWLWVHFGLCAGQGRFYATWGESDLPLFERVVPAWSIDTKNEFAKLVDDAERVVEKCQKKDWV